MENRQHLEEYQYSNAGQYRAIMQSLGYQTEYNKKYILFTKGNEQFRTKLEEIKKHATKEKSTEESLERVCKLFDKERSSQPAYLDELKEKGISIVNWGDIKSDNKDRFTVIDHRSKVCYTGKELYDYALQNRYLLDGKGSKAPENSMSELIRHNGKQAKLRYTENGVSIFYKKEKLEIPDSILGHKLKEQEKADLYEGKRIQINSQKGNIYLEIDRELNSIIILSEKELHIPQEIGGYRLTNADQYLLANGHTLENKLLHNREGYFLADISFAYGNKGISFGNVQMIPEYKAKELLQHTNKEMEQIIKLSGNLTIQNAVEVLKKNGIDAGMLEQNFATMMTDKVKQMYFHVNQKKVTDWEIKLDENKYKHSIKSIEELMVQQDATPIRQEQPTNELPELKDQRAVDSYIQELIQKESYSQLDRLQQKGYSPSKELMASLNESCPDNTIIAVKKIFHIDSPHLNMLGEIKITPPARKPELSRPVGNTINKMFSDL